MSREQGPLLALVREDYEIDRLPDDPKWFMAAAVGQTTASFIVLGLSLCTLVVGWLYFNRMDFDDAPAGASIAVGAILPVCLGLMWLGGLYRVRGREERSQFYDEYPRVRAAVKQPRTGIVTRAETTQADDGTIQKCWIDVALDGGGSLRATRHPHRSIDATSGGRVARGSHHAPQYGDAVTVFDDPMGVLPPLVLTNRRSPESLGHRRH